MSTFVTVKLDEPRHAATLEAADDQPEGLVASSQGNGQTLPGGDVFVGWGNLNYVSEFDPSGALTFNAAFPAGVNTYRAYLLPWGGHDARTTWRHRGR
jgi:Arylsulfotransferase (ASST)